MKYPLLKLALLLSLLFALCIALIRAQPYDDSELRAFLTPPDGCPMPCFMGIRPGGTTADEAVAILEAHEWVGSLERHSNITVTWSGAQPHWLPDTRPLQIIINDHIVRRVFVPTNIHLGDVWLALGPPARLFRLESLDNLGSFNMAYPFGMIGFTVRGSCSMRSIWMSSTFIDLDVERSPARGLEGADMLRDVVQRCWRLRPIASQ